jgi:UDP-N-acetylmuramate--alanine ligase
MNRVPEHLTRRPCVPAKSMPLDIGVVHFVGIGGIGMSGIAEILHNLGYQVAGSDNSDNATVQRLRAMGIKIAIGQRAENVENVAVVVKSTAVPMTNPEIVAARANDIPVVKRSEMLAELTNLKATIAVAGSHGKTTTTSLVGHILESANMQPTVINGGIINAYGTNAHLGEGDWLVAEADESDGTFIRIPATIGIITNMDPEHLDYWGSYDELKKGFRAFIDQLPFYGFAALCYDHDAVRELGNSVYDRRIVSYGVESVDVDIRAVNLEFSAVGSTFDVEISERLTGGEARVIKSVKLAAAGVHNILNALAALAVAV